MHALCSFNQGFNEDAGTRAGRWFAEVGTCHLTIHLDRGNGFSYLCRTINLNYITVMYHRKITVVIICVFDEGVRAFE